MDPNNYNIEEICTVSNDQELASIIQNTDDNCTIIIVDENNNFQFTDSTVNNIFETNLNESFDLNEEHSTEHIYANVQILNPTTSSTCSNELQSDSTDNFIYTAVALPNENKTIASRNAEEIDEDPSHQGEGNGNNTTRKQNVKNTEEQNENTIEEQNVETNENDETMRGRKRKRQSELWKQNLRKRRRQSGMEYVNTRGKTQRKREVKQGTKDCKGGCRFKCSKNISETERKAIFKTFWSYSDSEKNAFYGNNIEKLKKERKRTNKEISRKQFTYKYHLPKECSKLRICKEFFLSTLDISGRRIQWFFDKKSPQFEDKRGRHVKRKISDESKDRIRNHINSFPRMDSHYCRSSVKRQYLDPCLSIAKMYELYVLTCNTTDVTPEKYHTYKNIFNFEFNLGFHTPKKDRCDHCEEYKSNKLINQVGEDLKIKYELHIAGKSNTKVERDNDRSSDKAVLCFDMENVITCPRANISNFFYKRKLNVFNLTGHFSLNKCAYNAIWPEHIAGRGANEISSALLKILEKVLEDFPSLETITLWSDSCIPQNRNSIVISALQHFMKSDRSYSLKSVEQKFSEPGHSSIQEVDCVHSHIEKALNLSEIFSPVSFLRILTKVRKRSMKVIQLQPEHFFDFQTASRTFKYNSVPFTKVKYLKLEVEKPLHVLYKVSFSDESFKEVSIVAQNTRKKQKTVVMPKVNMLTKSNFLSKEKVKDLKDMLKYMPLDDRKYYETVFKSYK
ncbi:uncharacterized protein LOC143075857 [Mytilus galloprovincialis]|uniref:uncharacterized protein LOC143075857 n=1 Tax=Mytilus galloprovincialis TaxID=29158 RepID=UPI003F7BD6F1